MNVVQKGYELKSVGRVAPNQKYPDRHRQGNLKCHVINPRFNF